MNCTRWLTRLSTLAVLATLATHVTADTPGNTSKDSTKDSTQAKWDIAVPHVPSDTIEFTSDEGTWMTVDVSPDGKEIAFDLLGDIYKMPISGGSATLLAGGLAYDIQPRWSPDGKRLLFTSDRGGGDNIWIMNADGTNPVQITKEDFRLLNNPAWHPSGKYIVARKHFTGFRSIGAGEMWMYKVPEGGKGVQLTKRKNDQMDANEPVFSPDGKYLYWAEDMSPGQSFQYNKDPNGTIYVIRRLDLQTNEIRDIVQINGGACRPEVSPDGKTLAFVRRVHSKSVLSLYNFQTNEVRPLWDSLSFDQQETWALFGVYPGFSWTPDGKSIVIWADGKIWRVDVATGKPTQIPFEVKSRQVVAKALRFDQSIGHETFPVKVIRWPQVTPTGNEVIFQALGYLYHRPMGSGTPTRITKQVDHFEFAPALSPDGREIVFTTWNDTTGGSVRVISVDGRSERVVAAQPGHYVSATFSPDGKQIVYHRGTGDGYRGQTWENDPGIYLIDALGKSAPLLLTREGESPRFSKDGKCIYLNSNEGDKTALVSVDLLGSDRRVLATSQYAADFRLSPDEQWLAFEELWQAYVVPFTVLNQPLEVSPEMNSFPVKKLSTDAGTYLSWSPDSKILRWSLGPDMWSVPAADLYQTDTTKIPKPDVTNLSWQEKSDIPNTDLYFVNARILPMNDLSVIENGVVHVKGNRIADVGTKDQVTVPSGATVIDVAGKTLMPGIVDVHAHPGSSNEGIYAQQSWGYLANLAFGVTTMHDPSNNSQMVFSMAELAKHGDILSPRVFSTGTILYGADGGFKTVINKYDDAVNAIKRTIAWGAISVKSYNQPRREQRQQIIKAARELNTMVVPEGGSTFNYMMTLVLDGQTTLEHPFPVTPIYKPELTLMGRFGTGYTPTLIVGYGGLFGENYWYQHSNVWENTRLMHFTPRSVVEPRSMRRTMAPEDQYHHFALSKVATDILHHGGNVELGAHGQLQGLGAHWELWMLQQGGMTNHEALQCATWRGARVLGMDKELGSIQKGLLADIIVIDGDPTKDIRQSENVIYTMINGRLYDAKTLDELSPERKKLPRGPEFDGNTLSATIGETCPGD